MGYSIKSKIDTHVLMGVFEIKDLLISQLSSMTCISPNEVISRLDNIFIRVIENKCNPEQDLSFQIYNAFELYLKNLKYLNNDLYNRYFFKK